VLERRVLKFILCSRAKAARPRKGGDTLYESQPCIAIAKTRVVRRRQQAEETNLFT
jgi:hypothetical protein